MKEKIKKPIWKKWWVWIIAIIIVSAIAGTGNDTEKLASNDNNTSIESSSSDNKETVKEDKKEEKKDKKIKAGTYKIGTDISEGEYLFISKGMGYIEVSSNSSGTLDSIITNDNIKGHSYITVNNDEYLKTTGGDLYKVSEAPSIKPKDGIYKDGKYKVGQDIAAGEYKVSLTSGMGYVEVSSNSRGTLDSIISNENLTGDSYITVQEGQYLKIQGVEIKY